jgi:HSP20 family protein
MAETSTVPVKKTNGMARTPTPFGWLGDLEGEMERFWRGPWSIWTTPMPRPFGATAWAPRMDVFEKDDTLVVKAELPGLKKEDVQVELAGRDLIIRGESKAEKEIKEEDYVRSERTFGSFYRRMPLPTGVTPDQVQATLTDGVLEVHVQRPAEAKPEPKTIAVN